MKRTILTGLAVLAATSFSSAVHAADPWEAAKGKDLTVVVSYGTGGSTDATTRILAKKLNELGLDVNVVNKPGASGTEGTYWVSQQPPTSGVFLAGTPTAFHFLAAAEETGYDWTDFDPVAMWSSAAFGFAVPADSDYETMEELIQAAKDSPGEVSVGSTGSGGEYQYMIDQIFTDAGTEIRYVGFKGGGEVATNLLGGHIDAGYISVAGAAPLVRDDKLRLLAHTSEVSNRLEAFPEVPHVRELGYDVAQNSSYALWAPKGTDPELREALAAAVEAATKDPEVIEANNQLGLTIQYKGIEDLKRAAEEIESTVVPAYVAWSKKK